MPTLLAWSELQGAEPCIRRLRRPGRPDLASKESRSAPQSGTRCVVESWLESEFDSSSRRVTGRSESLLKDCCIEYIIEPRRQDHLFVLADLPGVTCAGSCAGVAAEIKEYFREEDRVKEREKVLAHRIQFKVQIDPPPELLVRFESK